MKKTTLHLVILFSFISALSFAQTSPGICDGNTLVAQETNTALPLELDPGSTITADCENLPNIIAFDITETAIIGQTTSLSQVVFDIQHTFSGDLDISLVSPAGTSILLSNRNGGNTIDAFSSTIFADGGEDIMDATPPYQNTIIQPEGGNFADVFDGESITGTWELRICDDAGGDTGQVVFAGIVFCETPAPPNDLIENAIDVDEIGFPYTDTDVNFPTATQDQITNSNCSTGALPQVVWYKFTAVADGTATATFENGVDSTNSFIIFYSADNENAGLDGDLTFVNSGTNVCANADNHTNISIEAVADQTYYILVHSLLISTINIDFVRTPMPPPNDLIENAIDVDEIGLPYTDSDINFPDAMGEQLSNTNGCDANVVFLSVWYKFTAFADGTVTATIDTDNADSTIVFYSAADENATVDTLTFEQSGTNSCDFDTEKNIEAVAGQTYYVLVLSSTVGTVTIESDTVLSTEENTIEGFSFFPNPVQDVLSIQSTQAVEQVTLYNITGQKVLDQKINATNTQLSLGNLPSGIYLMTASTGTSTATYKVIKQ